MNEKLCQNCKHWSPPQGTTNVRRILGKCMAAKEVWDHEEWSEDGDYVILDSDAKMFVDDGSDYRAELLTRPDFGCVEWEQD